MSPEIILITFQVLILIMSVVIHEFAHGLSALWLGDATAKYAGRLTLNPLKHLDFWGSFVVPFLMILTMGIGIGWAKPVPYNPYNLRDQIKGPALVGLSGPFSNILLALVFGLAARFIPINYMAKVDILKSLFSFNFDNLTAVIAGSFGAIFFLLFSMVALVNIILAFFNLIPIPPLDGSKLLFAILPIKIETKIMLEQFGFVFLLVIFILFSGPLSYFLSLMRNLFFQIVVGV